MFNLMLNQVKLLVEKINEYRQEIAKKLYEYTLEDIYNCDEIGI